MMSFKLFTEDMERRLRKLEKESPAAFQKALEIAAIQFLDWANEGSVKESRKPPIRRGFLRGSSSAFVGDKLVSVYSKAAKGNPNENFNGGKLNITWGWNTAYATRMHETDYNPGPYSQQDGDAGNKWLEKHLKADRDLLMEVIAEEFGKGVGTR